MDTILTFLGQGDLVAYLTAGAAVLYGLTHVAALTPTPKDDRWLSKILKLIDPLVGNYRNVRRK